MMMRLGTFTFALRTAAFQQLTRERRYRWVPQERLNRSPAYQSLGLGDQTLELRGVLYQALSPFRDPLERLRKHAEQGQPLLLIDGRGKIHGRWCIQSIREEGRFFERDGDARRTEFQLSLVSYGDDHESKKLSYARK